MRITVEIDDATRLSFTEVLSLFAAEVPEGSEDGNLLDQMSAHWADLSQRSAIVGAKVGEGVPLSFGGAEIGKFRVK